MGKTVGKINPVVPYIGTWIETKGKNIMLTREIVVPYIGTWIETLVPNESPDNVLSYLI